MKISGRFIFLSVVVLFAGCTTDDPYEQSKNFFRFTKEYWGEWMRLDTGETWYLNDTQILIKDIPYPNKLSLRKENRNAIEVTEGSHKYYIYASRIKDATFRGRVVYDSGNVIGGSEQGVGSIAVIIGNLNNASDKTTVITDEYGNYVVEEIIPWDTYEVTIDGKTWTVTPGDGDDVGIMSLHDGMNLKAYLSVRDMDMLWTENNYPLHISIQNIGETTVPEETYAFYSFESPGIWALSNPQPGDHIPLGGLRPKGKKSVSFSFVADDDSADEYAQKGISVTIADPRAGITIKDYASINIKKKVSISINSQFPVKGILIAPYKKAYHLGYAFSYYDSYDNRYYVNGIGSGGIPWCRNDYLLILSGTKNTTYSIGIGVESSTQWAALTDRNIYKPHNTEETATLIQMKEQKMAFLNTGEIAYYRINMSNERP